MITVAGGVSLAHRTIGVITRSVWHSGLLFLKRRLNNDSEMFVVKGRQAVAFSDPKGVGGEANPANDSANQKENAGVPTLSL